MRIAGLRAGSRYGGSVGRFGRWLFGDSGTPDDGSVGRRKSHDTKVSRDQHLRLVGLGLDQRTPDDRRIGRLGHWCLAVPDRGRCVLRKLGPDLMNLGFGL